MRRTTLSGFLALLVSATSPGPAALYGESLQVPLAGGRVVLSSAAGEIRVALPAGTPVGRELRLPLAAGSEISSLVAVDGGWIAAGSTRHADGRRLFLWRGTDGGVEELAVPPSRIAPIRQTPVVLVDGGRLAGLAWLEGGEPRALGVRAAVWDGAAWGVPEEVAGPGPGSQLAVTGAVLADASWLLAWSRFDGGDDEIVWSLRDASGWRPARRVAGDNGVPDITPALSACGGQVLLAWSRYDGADYRLQLARFSGVGWQRVGSGPAGTLFPRFSCEAAGPVLSLRTVRPRGWAVVELDRAGAVRRQAFAASDAPERPVVVAVTADGVELRWPRAEVTASLAWEEVP